MESKSHSTLKEKFFLKKKKKIVKEKCAFLVIGMARFLLLLLLLCMKTHSKNVILNMNHVYLKKKESC